MVPPKSIGELWFTADGLLSISAISYTKRYDKSCLQTMSCCSILWLRRAVPGQMLWWKVRQYRTTAVYTGVLKSQEKRVAHLRMRIKVPIVLVSSYNEQQKWSKAWEKVLSCIQSVGKKRRDYVEGNDTGNKIYLICCFFPHQNLSKLNDGKQMGAVLQLCYNRSVTSRLFSPVWFFLHHDSLLHTDEGVLNLASKILRVISHFVNLVGSV